MFKLSLLILSLVSFLNAQDSFISWTSLSEAKDSLKTTEKSLIKYKRVVEEEAIVQVGVFKSKRIEIYLSDSCRYDITVEGLSPIVKMCMRLSSVSPTGVTPIDTLFGNTKLINMEVRPKISGNYLVEIQASRMEPAFEKATATCTYIIARVRG